MKLSFVIFTDGRLFRAAESLGYQPKVAGILNSFVISVKINDQVIHNLTEKVEIIFKPSNKVAYFLLK